MAIFAREDPKWTRKPNSIKTGEIILENENMQGGRSSIKVAQPAADANLRNYINNNGSATISIENVSGSNAKAIEDSERAIRNATMKVRSATIDLEKQLSDMRKEEMYDTVKKRVNGQYNECVLIIKLISDPSSPRYLNLNSLKASLEA